MSSPRPYEEIAEEVAAAMKVLDTAKLSRSLLDLEAIDSPHARAMWHTVSGVIATQSGEHDAALEHYGRAEELSEELDDNLLLAGVLVNRGLFLTNTGALPKALSEYQRAIDLYQTEGARDKLGSVFGNTGNIYAMSGDYPTALEYFHRALDLHLEFDQQNGVGGMTCNIGNLLKFTGDFPQALEYYHRALVILEQVGNKRFLANVLTNMGGLYDTIGSIDESLTYHYRALDVFTEIGNHNGIAIATGNIGHVLARRGELEQGLEFLDKAKALHRSVGEYGGISHVITSAINVLQRQGAWEEIAVRFAELDALTIADPQSQVMREIVRSDIYAHEGRLDEAVEAVERALKIAQEHSNRSSEADVHLQLRELALKRNDLAAYVEHNHAYTRINDEINGKDTATKVAMQDAERRVAAEREQHQKQLAVLYSTLPKHIADRVAAGEVVNDEHEHAAVLFMDIAGFTTHSGEMSPQQTTALLAVIFNRFDAICAEHHITKIKTIGDSYMAVAFPEESSNSEQRAAGIEERLASAAMKMITSSFTWPDASPLQFRIGMHSGPVVAGVIGTQRMQYDVWGDTVNVASRMESTGEAGRVHVSEQFASLLSPGPSHLRERGDSSQLPVPWSLRERGAIEIKGKGRMTTYWLEGA